MSKLLKKVLSSLCCLANTGGELFGNFGRRGNFFKFVKLVSFVATWAQK